MEETLQQEKQESEYKDPNEGQDGIRRRLRDRNLLRKRKAEAEEKETNQWVLGVESQRKRPRADGGTKRRGRPRKSELGPEISVIQEEAAEPQEDPAVVVVPEPAEVIPDQTPGSLAALLPVEPQPSSFLAAPAPPPELGSFQSVVLPPTLTSPVPVNPTPVHFSPSLRTPSPVKVLDTAPAPADFPVPVPNPISAPVLAAAPAPPAEAPQVETLFTESQGSSEALDQVLIEDLGPDEKQDFPPSQDKRAEEDLIETTSISVPERNEVFSVPAFSSVPPPQKYFPGNSF